MTERIFTLVCPGTTDSKGEVGAIHGGWESSDPDQRCKYCRKPALVRRSYVSTSNLSAVRQEVSQFVKAEK
jgi:hypothetical protein